jgi:hypothetical protein
MRCFACNAEIEAASGDRIGFRDECPRCGADLHTCRNCAHHDPNAYNECREPQSERVSERDRANRCDYFSSGEGGGGSAGARGSALSKLDALFKK